MLGVPYVSHKWSELTLQDSFFMINMKVNQSVLSENSFFLFKIRKSELDFIYHINSHSLQIQSKLRPQTYMSIWGLLHIFLSSCVTDSYMTLCVCFLSCLDCWPRKQFISKIFAVSNNVVGNITWTPYCFFILW